MNSFCQIHICIQDNKTVILYSSFKSNMPVILLSISLPPSLSLPPRLSYVTYTIYVSHLVSRRHTVAQFIYKYGGGYSVPVQSLAQWEHWKSIAIVIPCVIMWHHYSFLSIWWCLSSKPMQVLEQRPCLWVLSAAISSSLGWMSQWCRISFIEF